MAGHFFIGRIPTASFSNGFIEDYVVRANCYWALFPGACGHTYSCHPVWQFWEPGLASINYAHVPWKTALHLPAAWQMRHARHLMESRPVLARRPLHGLLVGDCFQGADHLDIGAGRCGGHLRPARIAAVTYFAAAALERFQAVRSGWQSAVHVNTLKTLRSLTGAAFVHATFGLIML